MDREKVMKGLECCIKRNPDDNPRCGECPYDGACLNRLKIDALELLKGQEAVAPVMVPHSRGIAYNCGSCGTEIAVIRDTVSADWQKNSVRFCQRCGRAVKWNG